MHRSCIVLWAILLVGGSVVPAAAQPPSDDGDSAAGQPDTGRGNVHEPELRSARRASFLRKAKAQSGVTPEQQKRIDDNCIFGMPVPLPGVDVGPSEIVYREGYVLQHSSLEKIPYWVCERATKSELTGPLTGRQSSWFEADPQLTSGRAELEDYKGSGYDRGHLAPNGNQTVNLELRKQTFYLSNMAPQEGRDFNQSIWAALEDQVRDWATDRGEAWIITGTMFYDPLEEDDATADGVVPYYTVGDGEVAVPTHWFKIVVAKSEAGDWESLAFVMENKKHGRPFRFDDHLATVKWIEERAGFNFMPDVVTATGDPQVETDLESVRGQLWD